MFKFINIKFFFIIINIVLFLFGSLNYVGNKLIFLIYAFVINLFLIRSFGNKGLFFEKFLSLFIWLGYWFKFLYTLTVTGEFRDSVGRFDYTASSYDTSLTVVIISISSLIIFSYIRSFFFTYNFENLNDINERFLEFYTKYRKFIFLIFLLSFSTLAILNYEFNIYRKGYISDLQINFIILGIFKWLTIFGFCSFSAFILFYEIKIKKNILLVFLLTSLEGLITNIGFLSRGMIFNQLSILLGIKKFFSINKIKFGIKKFLTLVSVTLFFFFLSVYFVTMERSSIYLENTANKTGSFDERPKFNIDQNSIEELKKLKLKKEKILKMEESFSNDFPFLHHLFYLFVNRWIGMESMVSVVSYPNLNFDIVKESLKERYDNTKYTYYERKFLGLTESYNINYPSKIYGVILPGFLAFSFYSGSFFLLIIYMLVFYSFGSLLEVAAYKFSQKNVIFSSLIGQVLAYRLIHFGYLPHQSYLLITSILLNIIIYFVVLKYFSSKN